MNANLYKRVISYLSATSLLLNALPALANVHRHAEHRGVTSVTRHYKGKANLKHFTATTDSRLVKDPSVCVIDLKANHILFSENAEKVRPIASLTKLMTFLVDKSFEKKASISPENLYLPVSLTKDNDTLRHTRFKLENRQYSLEDLRRYYLSFSNNNAAMAVSRFWSQNDDRLDFVAKMNKEANMLGMTSTIFKDSTGLETYNMSSALDLTKLIRELLEKAPDVTKYSTVEAETIYVTKERSASLFKNTNPLLYKEKLPALLSKTGYIKESGFNLIYVPSPSSCEDKGQYGILILGMKSVADRTKLAEHWLKTLKCMS